MPSKFAGAPDDAADDMRRAAPDLIGGVARIVAKHAQAAAARQELQPPHHHGVAVMQAVDAGIARRVDAHQVQADNVVLAELARVGLALDHMIATVRWPAVEIALDPFGRPIETWRAVVALDPHAAHLDTSDQL